MMQAKTLMRTSMIVTYIFFVLNDGSLEFQCFASSYKLS